MNRSRKIFILFSIIFIIALAYASYDISSRTTFPGSKSQLKERLKKDYLPTDSAVTDSTKKKTDKKYQLN